MKEVIVAGMRPTGDLHIGHYVGMLKNCATFQHDHECFYFLADWHALTSNYESLEVIRESRREYLKGWMASGVDPEKAHFYNQSSIPEILYLSQFFLNMTPPGWADRSPSWKDLQLAPDKKLDNLGFYTYPVLQAADIAIVRGEWVPIGEDQLAHLEIARNIVRKFNRIYGTDLPEINAKLTDVPRLLGIDGNKKMSSSIGNVITLMETEKSLQKKINKMKTDDKRNGIENPGNPDNCMVFDYHKIFSPENSVNDVCQACKSANIGCGECKKILGGFMSSELMPIAEKMGKISNRECDEILDVGNKFVGERIREHWEKLRSLIGF